MGFWESTFEASDRGSALKAVSRPFFIYPTRTQKSVKYSIQVLHLITFCPYVTINLDVNPKAYYHLLPTMHFNPQPSTSNSYGTNTIFLAVFYFLRKSCILRDLKQLRYGIVRSKEVI
jgi:hypothetical protein